MIWITIIIMILEGFLIYKISDSQNKLLREEIEQLREENIMLKDQVKKWEERVKRNAIKP